MDIFADIVGVLGVGLVVVAYALLQLEKITVNHITYSLLNMLGSFGIMFSLNWTWNLPSFVIQSFWILISLYGIVKVLRGKRVVHK